MLPCLARTFGGGSVAGLTKLKPQQLRAEPDSVAGGVLVYRAIQGACLAGAGTARPHSRAATGVKSSGSPKQAAPLRLVSASIKSKAGPEAAGAVSSRGVPPGSAGSFAGLGRSTPKSPPRKSNPGMGGDGTGPWDGTTMPAHTSSSIVGAGKGVAPPKVGVPGPAAAELPISPRSMSSASHSRKRPSSRAREGGTPAAKDITLDDLYSVYGRVFKAAMAGYTGSTGQDVKRLIGVLMAAQEPLPFSFLQQLGLGEAISSLPGYPTLFYMDEHHLYTLHKSLGEWWVRGGDGSCIWGPRCVLHHRQPTCSACVMQIWNWHTMKRRHGTNTSVVMG